MRMFFDAPNWYHRSIPRAIRTSEGFLRRVRNLCVSALLETVRDRQRETGLEQINRVLMQPHWRKEYDLAAQ